MATDFLIFGLLLVSLSINLLALGAFWVTPGLRTTANRFVINLLIVNLVVCIVLGPTLFLNSPNVIEEKILKIEIKNNHLNKEVNIKSNITETNYTELIETIVQCNSSQCEKITIEDDPMSDTILITDMNIKADPTEVLDDRKVGDLSQQETRCWSLDLAAALGSLSVLLVVGDTWCAVTDPLRYHSRISWLKSWVLIGITWSFGILFGILSALRGTAFNILGDHDDLEIPTEDGKHESGAQGLESDYRPVTIQANDLYDIIFSCLYFSLIILLPFGFVCGMYWRIFSEARENGLRVRQNGSSPLLQSALNLSATSSAQNAVQHNLHATKESLTAGGLTIQLERRRSSDREIMKPLLFPVAVHRPSQPSNTTSTEEKPTIQQDRNQNILLTLSAANEEIRRNYSAKQLSLLGSSDEDVTHTSSPRKQGIRHVHSTPNLQKTHEGSGFTAAIGNSHNALQLPTIQASPKALSYMTSIRHRLSNASSLFKYREESRAARISILVVIMFLVSYLPYGLLVLLQSRLTNLLGNSTKIMILMVLLGNLSSPFIFAYRNKRVRRGVRRLFGLDRRSRESKFHRSGGLLRRGTKASINVRRSASKASTYSVNSCKFLAPHSVNNGTFLMEIEQCHYLNSKNKCQRNNIDKALKDLGKRSILKMVCDSSRKLGCATNSCATSDNEQTDV